MWEAGQGDLLKHCYSHLRSKRYVSGVKGVFEGAGTFTRLLAIAVQSEIIWDQFASLITKRKRKRPEMKISQEK